MTKGESPVLDADVRVDVTVTMPNGSHIGESIKLLDNGNGGTFGQSPLTIERTNFPIGRFLGREVFLQICFL